MKSFRLSLSWCLSVSHWLLLLLFPFLLAACEGRPKFMYPTVPAERYFTGSAALPAAQACQHDDAAALTKALAAAHLSPNAVGEQGMSLLLLAMSNRSLHAVRALLAAGANPNLHTRLGADKLDTQPVALAAGGDNTPLLTVLLDHGGDPNSHFGSRPAIFCAADADRYNHLRLLLDRGADINVTDKEGTTLLIHLAERNQFDQVAYLIKRGADVHKADRLGGTVAFEVQETRYTLTDSLERWNEEVQRLLEARGVTFPVPNPSVAFQAKVRQENAQRRRWEATPEGRQYRDQIAAAEQERAQAQDRLTNGVGKPDDNARAVAAYTRGEELRVQAEPRCQAWRKTQPDWFPTTNESGQYPRIPTLAQEAADIEAEKAAAAPPTLVLPR